MTIIIIMFVLCIIIQIVNVYFFIYRKDKIFELRIKILKENPDIYNRLPSYENMVFSFKKIKLESWYDNK